MSLSDFFLVWFVEIVEELVFDDVFDCLVVLLCWDFGVSVVEFVDEV